MSYRAGPVGEGTISGSSGASTITGSGSDFTNQFQAGDTIVLIDSSGNHDAYVVSAVTNATSLTITGTLSEAYSAVSYYGQRDAHELITMAGENVDPATTYQPGAEAVVTAQGTLQWRGYPRSTWQWGWMTVTDWTSLKAYLADGAYSAACYVEVRDDEDTYTRYYAIVRFPDPARLRRWRSRYLSVSVEFILVESVT